VVKDPNLLDPSYRVVIALVLVWDVGKHRLPVFGHFSGTLPSHVDFHTEL
jgi:hypothetical protein